MSEIGPTAAKLLSDASARQLAEKWLVSGKSFTVSRLAIALQIDLPSAVALMSILQARNLVRGFLEYYHLDCESPDVPIGRAPIAQGPPAFPFECPLCEDSIESSDALAFEFLATVQ